VTAPDVGGGESLDARLGAALARPGPVVVLTGAGISAASGIPTFRGRDGYWSVGSNHYAPQEMATAAMFARHPEAVWGWYLYRRAVCDAAQPNAAHRALVDLEHACGARFVLLTQNVDGLHLRAGQSPERTLHVHGNLHRMRCARGCSQAVSAVPATLTAGAGGEPVGDAERAALACGGCGGWMRPHVLWFDETYDEPHYRYESALAAASDAVLLIVVGTSGATTLPMYAAAAAARAGAFVVDVDPDDNPFARLALEAGGVWLRGGAVEHVPPLVTRCVAAAG
jgi:NAD-dependent deacetylase